MVGGGRGGQRAHWTSLGGGGGGRPSLGNNFSLCPRLPVEFNKGGQ